MRKIFLSIILIGFLAFSAAGQFQQGMGISQFWHRLPEIHNPALMPLHSVPSVSLIGSGSMSAFDRHPLNASLFCSGFLFDKMGGILKVNYDQMGLSSKTDVQLGLAYYVFINKKAGDAGSEKKGDKFSFSMSGHFIQDRLRRDDIVVIDPNDPDLTNIPEVSPCGDASAGIAFMRENKYYAGLSVYQALGLKSTFMNNQWENTRKRHYYLQGSYNFNLDTKNNFDLEVHGILAAIELSDYRWELGTSVSMLKAFTIGVAYQSIGAVKMDAGIKAQSWDFGYACSYGEWIDATSHTYLGFTNGIFVRKIFNEGRRSKE